MATWTGQSKNSASWTGGTKNSASWTGQSKSVGATNELGSPMGLLLTLTYPATVTPSTVWTAQTKN